MSQKLNGIQKFQAVSIHQPNHFHSEKKAFAYFRQRV